MAWKALPDTRLYSNPAPFWSLPPTVPSALPPTAQEEHPRPALCPERHATSPRRSKRGSGASATAPPAPSTVSCLPPARAQHKSCNEVKSHTSFPKYHRRETIPNPDPGTCPSGPFSALWEGTDQRGTGGAKRKKELHRLLPRQGQAGVQAQGAPAAPPLPPAAGAGGQVPLRLRWLEAIWALGGGAPDPSARAAAAALLLLQDTPWPPLWGSP